MQRGPTDQALQALAATGGLQPRVPRPAPVLLRRQEQVSRLVSRWDDALADSLAAMNLYRDEPKERRRAAIERLVRQAGGECRPMGAFRAENALRGRWKLRCRDSDLGIYITLAPTEPARVQFLEVTPLARNEDLGTPAACR